MGIPTADQPITLNFLCDELVELALSVRHQEREESAQHYELLAVNGNANNGRNRMAARYADEVNKFLNQ